MLRFSVEIFINDYSLIVAEMARTRMKRKDQKAIRLAQIMIQRDQREIEDAPEHSYPGSYPYFLNSEIERNASNFCFSQLGEHQIPELLRDMVVLEAIEAKQGYQGDTVWKRLSDYILAHPVHHAPPENLVLWMYNYANDVKQGRWPDLYGRKGPEQNSDYLTIDVCVRKFCAACLGVDDWRNVDPSFRFSRFSPDMTVLAASEI